MEVCVNKSWHYCCYSRNEYCNEVRVIFNLQVLPITNISIQGNQNRRDKKMIPSAYEASTAPCWLRRLMEMGKRQQTRASMHLLAGDCQIKTHGNFFNLFT